MDFGFRPNFLSSSLDFTRPIRAVVGIATQPTQMEEFFKFETWRRPSFSIISWAVATSEKICTLWTIKELKRALQPGYDSLILSNWSKYFKGSLEGDDHVKNSSFFDFGAWGWPHLSVVSCVVSASDKVASSWISEPIRRRTSSDRRFFRPYVSRCPWHTGARAFLSLLFPRYGHYCGPNWSSGKMGGSLIWDMRPIDWLDFCCYCHDMGYDTEDQAQLLKADLAFLECLERPHMESRGDADVAHVYKTMCTKGLRYVLIPYRTQLLKLLSDKSPSI